jgi:hypothetical protein
MVSIGAALDFPPLTVRMATGGITMLAIILLSVASPNVSDVAALDQFSANLSDPAKADEFVAELLAKRDADRQALADAKSAKPRPAYNCPPWKPEQKGGLLRLISFDEFSNLRPNEIEDCGNKRLEQARAYSERNRPRLTESQRQQAHVMALTGGKGIIVSNPADLTPNIDAELAAQEASVANASKQKAAKRIEARTIPTPYLIGGGLLILAIGYGAGVRRRKAVPTSS